MQSNLETLLQRKWNRKTKPGGALGLLETLGIRAGSILQTDTPVPQAPALLVFAADHGLANEGLSAYPKEVTAQMVRNFLKGGAAVNVLARQNGLSLEVIDAGVDAGFAHQPGLTDAKIRRGTRNARHQPAMTSGELDLCFERGAERVRERAAMGCNVLGCGEMGIANTASASLLMSALCGLPVDACTGRGTGLDDAGLRRKRRILAEIRARHTVAEGDTRGTLIAFGGYEIAQMCGAFMEGSRAGMILLVDGFIATVAFLAASRLAPKVADNAVFCHCSDEAGHRRLLSLCGGTPLLDLGLRLGEGTGCALAYPLLTSACHLLNDMASFDEAGVSDQPGRENSQVL